MKEFIYSNITSFNKQNNFIECKLLESNIITNTRAAVVSIESIIFKSIYNTNEKIFSKATGFIVSKEKGWILTNRHVANINLIQDLYIKFIDGIKIAGKLVYNDPEHDFAIVGIPPHDMREHYSELYLSSEKVKNGQMVFMVSNEGFKVGTIYDQYFAKGHFSTQSMLVSFSSKPGDSGSPICNIRGEVIGLQFTSNGSGSAAIYISYIIDSLVCLNKGHFPLRNNVGAVFEYCDLYDISKFISLPEDQLESYLKKFPDSNGRAICVKRIFANYNDQLELGDVIWGVEGEHIGPNLYKLHQVIDSGVSGEINFEVFRFGTAINLEIFPYNIADNLVKKALYFDGAFFYKVDELTHLLTGASFNSIFVAEVSKISPFAGIPMSSIIKINNINIESINDIIRYIPKLESFTIQVRNYLPEKTFNHLGLNHHDLKLKFVTLESTRDIALYLFNEELYNWQIIDLSKEMVCSGNEHNYTSCEWDDFALSFLI